MDKEQFLKSGLLEQFALGLTTPEEDQIVEDCLNKFPELEAEVNELHQALDQYANTQLMSKESGVTPTDISTPARFGSTYKSVFKTLAVVVMAVLLAWSLFNRQAQNEQISHLKAEYAALEVYCQQSQEKNTNTQALIASTHAENTQPVLLKGTALAPNHFAIAYWNPEQKGAWIDPANLPSLPANQQYQVWADVEGEMINLGLIPANSKELVTINYLPQAESLNITQEKLGGADHPTVSLLTVNGIL